MLHELLLQFWKWKGITPKEYAMGEFDDFEEYMYPLWGELMYETEKLINMEKCDNQTMDQILTVLALDNEREDLLDYIEEYGSDFFIEKIALYGQHHMQPEARWQIAEILKRRKIKCAEEVLETLLNDPILYVAKRAYNAYEEYKNNENL